MATKKTFVLRIDPEVSSSLERWASDEFRSMNGQIEYILSQALKKAGRFPVKDQKSDDQETIETETSEK
ncbi:MAG: Arc family DNA-binding protein [Mariniphaga sp.]